VNEREVIDLLESHGAILRDTHVVYTSGRHGEAYVNKDALYPDTGAVSTLCAEIARHFDTESVEVVAAPAVGGVILSQWVAHHLARSGGSVLAVYAERSGEGAFAFRRGYDRLVLGRRVLAVEDVLHTGGSLAQVIGAVRAAGGEPIGAAVLVNRGAVTAEKLGGIPKLLSLASLALASWPAEECPLCARGAPIDTRVGKGQELHARIDHAGGAC
jgi:orotate phosphoribosyltransferase